VGLYVHKPRFGFVCVNQFRLGFVGIKPKVGGDYVCLCKSRILMCY
jgi:hypothetical protein